MSDKTRSELEPAIIRGAARRVLETEPPTPPGFALWDYLEETRYADPLRIFVENGVGYWTKLVDQVVALTAVDQQR